MMMMMMMIIIIIIITTDIYIPPLTGKPEQQGSTN